MPRATRSSARGVARATPAKDATPQSRKRSISSLSSTSAQNETPAPKRRTRDIRRHFTIELPALEAKYGEADDTLVRSTHVTPEKLPNSSPPVQASKETPAGSPHQEATPGKASPWPFSSLFSTVRRILSPITPKRLAQSISPSAPETTTDSPAATSKFNEIEQTPTRMASRQVVRRLQPTDIPNDEPTVEPTVTRKRKASDDGTPTATLKKAKTSSNPPRRRMSRSPTKSPAKTNMTSSVLPELNSPEKAELTPIDEVSLDATTPSHSKKPSTTPTRRSARRVREQRYNLYAEANKMPEINFTPPKLEAYGTHDETEKVPAVKFAPPKPDEPAAASSPSKKRKRVKIDDLTAIPNRRTGQSTGTFALLDEFFNEDEDSVELDEEDYDLYSSRPNKFARTTQNVFDVMSPPARTDNSNVNQSTFDATAAAGKTDSPNSTKITFDVSSPPKRNESNNIQNTPHIASSPPKADAVPASQSALDKSVAVSTPSAVSNPTFSFTQTVPEISTASADTSGPGADQLPDALQRKRSEAEKYKPAVGSRLKEMHRLSNISNMSSTSLASPTTTSAHNDQLAPQTSPVRLENQEVPSYSSAAESWTPEGTRAAIALYPRYTPQPISWWTPDTAPTPSDPPFVFPEPLPLPGRAGEIARILEEEEGPPQGSAEEFTRRLAHYLATNPVAT